MKLPTHLFPRGMASIAIGAAVLLAPRFISSAAMQNTVANAAWVGWLAVVLGIGLVAIAVARGRH